jgi:hypothetical protein
MAQYQHNPQVLYDDPLLSSVMTEEFNAVYLNFMERSRVNLSDEYRESIRRTICRAILPKIHQETKMSPQSGAVGRDERDFRDLLRREIGALLSQFLRGGVFDQLADT